ncbi:restriction endonuclease subunit S [Pantoea sp.]|uniref:restriction endonuclease subunit S n=1 Tax=Pantoea sp. TaxID=69393 RepID=UPI00289BE6B6|nr:restriction endonuclease subunit S [Pantoea sp.]
MINFWINKSSLKEATLIPKFYDPEIESYFSSLKEEYNFFTIRELVEKEYISCSTGHEIGKMAYGTGDIPFIRTSDISNWEIKTLPKQGVSEEIYDSYSKKQDIQKNDILIVRDGTYLIGTNCMVSDLDEKSLYQSHLIKVRVKHNEIFDEYIFFLLLNSPIIQRQIRNMQFTADTIDTIGNRFYDIRLPIPKINKNNTSASLIVKDLLKNRTRGKLLIKNLPFLLEQCLKENNIKAFEDFEKEDILKLVEKTPQDTITSEFGKFEAFWVTKESLANDIILPKYYDPEIQDELKDLEKTCDLVPVSDLIEKGILSLSTGDEIGKMAYGTGNIPFIRTSDFSNWEIKFDPKQGVSDEIYEQYRESQDIKENDILLVRDGTYLIGSSCIITSHDVKSLYCGGLYKIRVNNFNGFDPFLLLGIFNTYIVKRQIRTKQFTRDVIDTIGKRIEEVILPIPKSYELRDKISKSIKELVTERIDARIEISKISNSILPVIS